MPNPDPARRRRLALLALTITLALGACSDEQLMVTRLTATSYTVPRYTNYPTLTIRNMHNPSIFDRPSVTMSAYCIEDQYENLPMTFEGTFAIAAGETRDVALAYDDGFPYLTDFRLGCTFRVENWTAGGTVSFEWLD
jgi:hypothetical protein